MLLAPSPAAPSIRPRCLFVLALAACGIVHAGCSGGDADPRARESGPGTRVGVAVVEGMTMEEVLSAWGTPNVKVREDDGERWSYWMRDSRHRVVGRTYVFFDDRKRVIDILRHPEETPHPDERAPITISGDRLWTGSTV
jgi:hypothetical protein